MTAGEDILHIMERLDKIEKRLDDLEKPIPQSRTQELLHSLSSGELTREQAPELKQLLLDRLDTSKKEQPRDIFHEKRLVVLIETLDSYIDGKIDLMLDIFRK
jgi:hypothetical protein